MRHNESLPPASAVDDVQLSRLGDFMAAKPAGAGASPEDLAAATQLTLSRALGALLATQNHDPAAAGNRSVRTLFEGGGTVDEIILLKAYAKDQTTLRNPELPDKVARLFYYSAIAQGLSQYGQTVAQLTPEKIQKGLHWCLSQRWADPVLHQAAERGLAALPSES